MIRKKTSKITDQRKKKRRYSIVDIQLYTLCLIPILLVIVFNYLPMIGIIIAFKKYNYGLGIFGSKWVGFENFELFFKSNEFTRILWNTLSMNTLFIVFGMIAAVLTAILLYELRSRIGTKIFQTVLITPYFLSWVIVAYMVFAVLNPSYGYLNMILNKFGIQSVDWYTTPKAWPVILTIVSVWKGVGMDSVIYYAAMMGMDASVFEAAEVDGANKFQKTFYIVLPTLVPIITIMTILKIGGIFRADFGLFYQVTRNVGNLYSTTDVIDTYIFRTMREVGNMGISSAVGLLQSVVGFVLVIATNAASKKIDSDLGLF